MPRRFPRHRRPRARGTLLKVISNPGSPDFLNEWHLRGPPQAAFHAVKRIGGYQLDRTVPTSLNSAPESARPAPHRRAASEPLVRQASGNNPLPGVFEWDAHGYAKPRTTG